MPGLSVFFPAYNDAGTIASLVISAVRVAGTLTPDFEVIVINDGSTDDTPRILDELARVYPDHVRIVHHAKNRGYGGALRSGFAAATKDFKDAFKAKFGDVKQYAPYFYDGTIAVVEAMKKANSADPAKFGPELFNVSFAGATGKVEFDAKGDRKDAEITIFLGKGGAIEPVSIVKNGVAAKFEMAAPAPAAAPAAAKSAEAQKK